MRFRVPAAAVVLLLVLVLGTVQVLFPTPPGSTLDSVEASRAGLDYASVTGPVTPEPALSALAINLDSAGIGGGAGANWSLDILRFHYPKANDSTTSNYVFVSPAASLYSTLPQRVVRFTLGPLSWSIPLNVSVVRSNTVLYVPWASYVGNLSAVIGPSPGPVILLPIQPVRLLSLPSTAILGIHVDSGVFWEVTVVGIRSVYETSNPSAGVLVGSVGVGFVGLLAISFVLTRAKEMLSRGERRALASAVLGLLVAGLFVQDVWDLPFWQRFADFALYGGGNPVLLWGQHPLWPYLTVVSYAPYVLARAIVPDLSYAVGSLVLKLPALVGYLLLAFILRSLLDYFGCGRKQKKWAFAIWLLNPIPIWVSLWGQRDILAAAFFMYSLLLTLQKRHSAWPYAMLAVACALEEYFLLALPVFLVFSVARSPEVAVRRRLLALLVPVATFLSVFVVPLIAIPSSIIVATYGFRTTSLGGSSFIQLFSQSADPALLWAAGAAVLGIGFLFIARRLVRHATDTQLVVSLASMILLFYLASPEVNPQFLVAVLPIAIVLASLKVLSPWWVTTYSIISLFQMYAHFGFGEFVSPILEPHFTVGVFGVRGAVDVFLSVALSFIAVLALVELLSRRGLVFWTGLDSRRVLAMAAIAILCLPLIQVSLVLDGFVLFGTSVLLIAVTSVHWDPLSLLAVSTHQGARWGSIWSIASIGYVGSVVAYLSIGGLWTAALALGVFAAALLMLLWRRPSRQFLFWIVFVSAIYGGSVAAGVSGLSTLLGNYEVLGLVTVGLGLALAEMIRCAR